MTSTTIIGLINNAALLMALALIYDVIVLSQPGQKLALNQIPLGFVLGLIGIGIMMNPWEFLPGVIFDTRSVLLCITGFFFGTIPTLISLSIMGGYRLFIGGIGSWTGVAVIVSSGAVGLAWRHWRKKDFKDVSTSDLFLLGIITHILMLLWMLTLPRSIAFDVLSKISLPVILIFPLGTVLLGKLMLNGHERINSAKAIQESEEKYRIITENMADVITTMDLSLRFTYVSPSIIQLRGFTVEEAMGQTIDQIMTPDSLQAVSMVFEEELRLEDTGTADPGRTRIMELEEYKKDGSTIWVENTSSFIRDKEQKPVGILIVSRDITGKRRAELELRKSEQLLNEMGAIARIGGWEHDLLTGEATWTKEAYNIVEIDSYPVTGPSKHLTYYTPESRAILDDAYRRAIETGEQFDLRLQNTTAKGRLFWARVIGRPEFKDGKCIKMKGIFQDISEKIKLEEQLAQAQKMEAIGRLAGGVAHDYNNALSVIIGFTEMAIDEVDPHGPMHADLEEVLSAAKRATDITRQLLAFARKQVIKPKVLDLNDSVGSMLQMLRRLIGEDINLAWLPGASLWPIKMDPTQIDQILANLCVNARDAIEDVGKISIETSKVTFDDAYCSDHDGFVPGEFVLLTVSDNGCGIDKEIQDKIFEPFFTTKDVDKGTGLGMSTVYGIIKQNKGFINVYSEPGKGTTIKIYMPRHEGEFVEIQEKSAAEIPQSQGETLLLVEDDISILKLATKILDGLGYNVLTAETPDKVIALAKEHPGKIHLLITDVIMPEMNGRELSQKIQSLYPDLKCVFMSGYTADIIAHHGVLEEGVQFIQKPFSRIDLAQIVRKTLDEQEKMI